MDELLEQTMTIRILRETEASFDGHPSWYFVPSHLMPTLRKAQEMRRDVKIKNDYVCNIYAVEILPPPPSWFARLRAAGGRLRLRLLRQ